MPEPVKIAVIGGSGLYNMSGITNTEIVSVTTPFGPPSGEIVIGTLHGKRVAFLPRHGKGHVYSPTTVPYRANILSLKQLGVRFIIGVSACGSLREDYAPGHIVIPDQLYDNTKHDRGNSFFERDLVAHVSVAHPFCQELSAILYDAVKTAGGIVHRRGSFITIEGPRFSTKGESHIFRQWGCSIIGMTTSPEAFLAREAEIAYSTVAHITDYDVWHISERPVTVDMVVRIMHQNLDIVQRAIGIAVKKIDENADYESHNALKDAILTDRNSITSDALERLEPIVGRYFRDNP